MRSAYSAPPNRLAPCYLLATGVSAKHGQTATRHLGLLTATALPAEDTDHLILVWWQRTKRGSGPRDGSFVDGGAGGANMVPHGSAMSFLWERPGARPDPSPGSKKTRPK